MPRNTLCIFIDWNKTLSYSLFWGHLKNNHPYAHLLPKIEKCLFKDNREIINPWMRGKYSTKEIVSKIAKDILVPENFLMEELAKSCRNMAFCSDEIPELIYSIQQKNIKVVIATDNMDTFREFTIPSMQLDNLFDDFLISSETGVLKGDVRDGKIIFFEPFLQKNNLSYKEVVLLDDSTDITSIYNSKGFPIIHIDSPDSLINTLRLYTN